MRTRQNGNGLTVVVATETPPLEGDSLYTTMCIIGRYRAAMGMGDVLRHFHVCSRRIGPHAWGLKVECPERVAVVERGVASAPMHAWGLNNLATHNNRRTIGLWQR